jgi:alpha-galactosidase
MAVRKIVFLGGGAIYFIRAFTEFALRRGLEGSEFVLYDLDLEKAQRMANLGKRLFSEQGVNYRIRATTDMIDAIEGADFAISSIGGTGVSNTMSVYGSYYHGADMNISGKYGIHQIIGDTCGPSGMMMALRTIPVYFKICKEMEKRCPDVVFINHSNPMAVLCKAMVKYTDINFIGLCHGVQEGISAAARLLGVPYKELECVWIGTNHYYWYTRILHKGKDVYPQAARLLTENSHKGNKLTSTLSRIYGHQIVYRPDDHIYEFYPYASQIGNSGKEDDYGLMEEAKVWGYDFKNPVVPARSDASAEEKMEFYKDFQKTLDDVKLEKPGEYDINEDVDRLVSCIADGKREVFILNVPNQGAVPNLPSDAILEVEAVSDSKGVRPLYMGNAPLYLKGMLEKRIVWQEIVADAGVKGDKNLALQALLIDEMAILPDKAEMMLDELLAASKDLLPQFKL